MKSIEPTPDPRMVLIAQLEADLMAFIRERYQCADEAARDIRRRFLQWEMDAADGGIALQIEKDGKPVLIVSSDAKGVIDRRALEIGLRPAPKGEGAV